MEYFENSETVEVYLSGSNSNICIKDTVSESFPD